MNKINNIIRIPCKDLSSFFKYWFMFLKPLHNLTTKELTVAASFTEHRYRLSKVIKDNEVLDSVSMSNETKRKIRDDCGITLPHFQVIFSKLRKNNFIVDNKINPKYIPKLTEEKGYFKLMLLFDLQ